MKTVDEILAIYSSRMSINNFAKSRMRTLRDHYNGEIVVPLPEIDSNEQSAVANLLAQGLDQTAMRIASTSPDIYCPPADSSVKRSRNNASIKRRAIFGWWENSRMDLQLSKRARHLIGYATTCTQLIYNAKTGCPEWHVRDPLTAYPSPLIGPQDLRPRDCIFAYERTLGWLNIHYPEAAFVLKQQGVANGEDNITTNDQVIDLIEYLDAEETVLVASRSTTPTHLSTFGNTNSTPNVVNIELERIPNRLGETPVVFASRISLDAPQGQFDGILGMYQMQARLMALEVIAVQKVCSQIHG